MFSLSLLKWGSFKVLSLSTSQHNFAVYPFARIETLVAVTPFTAVVLNILSVMPPFGEKIFTIQFQHQWDFVM